MLQNKARSCIVYHSTPALHQPTHAHTHVLVPVQWEPCTIYILIPEVVAQVDFRMAAMLMSHLNSYYVQIHGNR